MDIENIIKEMTLEEKASLVAGSDFWHTVAIERLGVPAVMMCDGPHGLRKQKETGDHIGIGESEEAVCFPTAAGLAACFDRDLLQDLGAALGEACRAEDVGMILGPGLNIKRSPLCGRNFEYYSEDPYLAGELGAAFIKGVQSKGVAACPKHYAANNQETRRMTSDSRVDERTLHEIYLPAFEAAVKDGQTRSIMCSYNKVNGEYLAENKSMLTDILRDKWGFGGFVVTDWGAVKDRINGLLAGLDLEMPGPGRQAGKIVEAVNEGALDESILDNAARNVLRFVADYMAQLKGEGSASGLLSEKGDKYDKGEHRAMAVRMACESAVLMKNENNILPLDRSAKVAFIGAFAKKPRYQGAGSSFINVAGVAGAIDAAAAKGLDVTYAQGYRLDGLSDATDAALLQEAVDAAKAADVAVLFVGLPDIYESEGYDRENMSMPADQIALIKAVCGVQANTVAVLHGGAPFEMSWDEDISAIINMYLGGEQVGAAAVSVLFGDADPTGKLAETWPIKLSDNPSYLNFPDVNNVVEYREGIFVGYRYYDKKEMAVKYPFGHGLSYTRFAYSDLAIDRDNIDDTDIINVTCKVKNIGGRAGKEAVQLYVRQVNSIVQRSIRELRGFEKVALAPGEEKTVAFALDKRAFAYYETSIHDWHVESGVYDIEIGASSRDIRLASPVNVRSIVELPVVYTRHSAVGDMMRTERGRAMAQMMMGQAQANMLGGAEHLGEAAVRMMREMMMSMPLSAILNFGQLTEEQLEGMLSALNNTES